MKFTKTIVVAALVATAGVAQADLTANIGANSKYIFRGVELSDGAAISGGVDYDSGAGFYAGTWMSDIAAGGTELDLYAGFSGEAGSIGYDVNALYFTYPASGGDGADGDADYLELTVSLSVGPATAQLSYTPWEERSDNVDAAYGEGDLYYGLSFDLPMEVDGFTFSAAIGYYDMDDDGSNAILFAGPGQDELSYTHWNLSMSKDVGELGSFTLAYDETDGDEDDNALTTGDALFTVGWSKEF